MTTRSRARSPGSPSCPSSAAGWISSGAALAGLLAAGCQPDLGARASEVTGLRVLAVSGAPPGASPGSTVGYAAHLVDERRQKNQMPTDWAYCNQTKPLSDLGDVSS